MIGYIFIGIVRRITRYECSSYYEPVLWNKNIFKFTNESYALLFALLNNGEFEVKED
jgi:hypothetical protein